MGTEHQPQSTKDSPHGTESRRAGWIAAGVLGIAAVIGAVVVIFTPSGNSAPKAATEIGAVASPSGGSASPHGTPGVALASPSRSLRTPVAVQASGTAQPFLVERSDNAEFSITCAKPSASANLTAPWLGLKNNTPMIAVSPTTFVYDMPIPNSASPGFHPVNMRCADGSTVQTKIYVSSSRG